MNILGLSAFYHDSGACLVRDGEIVAAAQEERFTRKKHDASFPLHAVRYCLQEGGLTTAELDAVGFYDKPFLKFERILETYLSIAPRGLRQFLSAMPVWLKDKLWTRETLRETLEYSGPLLFAEHHESHAASAFYPSPFPEAAILTLDGVGEWATSSLAQGRGHRIELLRELQFPHSLGLLYSAFTYYLGFKVNSGEYKVMGLAPYGTPQYASRIYDHLLDLKEDGSFRLDLSYFDYLGGLRMTSERFHRLFGAPPRAPESRLTSREMDIAASLQAVTEEIMLRMARTARLQTGMRFLCLAGGVALNCVGNGKILREKLFDDLWIQPAAGDAGGAVGAALCVWHQVMGKERNSAGADRMQGAYLGPHFDTDSIRDFLVGRGLPFNEYPEEAMIGETVRHLAGGRVVGWFQGRMEFGPRALGNRSILGDPRDPAMQSVMNLKIKQRESFRPFAPSVLAEKAHEWFELDTASPYMLLVAPVRADRRKTLTGDQKKRFGIDLLHVPRSEVPAITHVDYSARIQTVHRESNPRYHALIRQFEEATGCPMLVNTSFNIRGEPIVCTPEQAYRCFMRTEMDVLVLDRFVLLKSEQPPREDDADARVEFEPD